MTKKTGTTTSSFGTIGRINHNSEKFYDSKLYKNLKKPEMISEEINEVPSNFLNKIVLRNSEDMSILPTNCLSLMITSPPYNASKEYDQDLSLKEHLELLSNVFKETYRVLINGGRACINIANLGRKPYVPLSDYISKIMLDLGFNMRGEIIWNKAASASPSTAWGSWMSASNPTLRDVHEYILVFSKGNYKRERDKQERKSKQNTISKKNFMEWTKSIWTFNAESARKLRHPAPFPVELPRRLIQLFSFTNDVVLDPFMGSGTTGIAALETGRKFIGFDINEDYVRLARNRLSPHENSLKISEFN